jgi:hypothetical protein
MTSPAGRRVLTELYAGQGWVTDPRWKDRRASKARTDAFWPAVSGALAGLEPAACCLGDVSVETLCRTANSLVAYDREAKVILSPQPRATAAVAVAVAVAVATAVTLL